MIQGREEEGDSPQKSDDKEYQYTPEDNKGQQQHIRGDSNDFHFTHPRRRPSDVSLLHNHHTPSTSSIPNFISGSDLDLGYASRSYATDGDISDSTLTPRATPIPKKTSLFVANLPIQIHVTKEQEQHSNVGFETRPGSPESVTIPSTLPIGRIDPPSPPLPFNLQHTEFPSQTSKPPARSAMMNDTTRPKPQYLDYYVSSPLSSSSSPRKRLFSRFSLSSSSSSVMSGLIAPSPTLSSGNEGTRVILNQIGHVQTNDGESVRELDSVLHTTLSSSSSYSQPSKREIEEGEGEGEEDSIARFSPNTSVKTVYAI